MQLVQFLAAAVCVVGVGCTAKATSTFDDPATDGGVEAAVEAGSACSTASDCASGLACGFRTVDGCGAHGVCVHKDIGACLGGSPDCACDGTLTSSCGLGGYSDKPFGHAGPCGAGAPCSATAQECGPGLACGFRGCGPGVCVAAPASTGGNCVPGTFCGCDGVTTTLCPLDDGSTRHPTAHAGPCEDGGPDASTDAQEDH